MTASGLAVRNQTSILRSVRLLERNSNRLSGNESISLFGREQMAVQWNKDADAALAEAKTNKKPVLVDFSAAPA